MTRNRYTAEEIARALGPRLASARHGSGKTQAVLAAELGVSNSYVALLERGQRQPSLAVLFSWAECCEMAAEELLQGLEAELEFKRRGRGGR